MEDMRKKIESVDKCPKCGCQVLDPFGWNKTIHDVKKCGGVVKNSSDEVLIIKR